jgi:hypothetical protein
MYENVHGAVNDPTQIATGTAELNTLYWNWQTFIFNVKSVPVNTPLYVYFWPYSTGGVAHIDGEITATLHYEHKQPVIEPTKVIEQVQVQTQVQIKQQSVEQAQAKETVAELVKPIVVEPKKIIKASKQVKYNENIETKRSL